MTGKGFLLFTGGLVVAYIVGRNVGLNMVQDSTKEPLQPQPPQQTNKSLSVNIPPQSKPISSCI